MDEMVEEAKEKLKQAGCYDIRKAYSAEEDDHYLCAKRLIRTDDGLEAVGPLGEAYKVRFLLVSVRGLKDPDLMTKVDAVLEDLSECIASQQGSQNNDFPVYPFSTKVRI